MKSLVWFRRDLRIDDNRALYNASINSSDGIIGLYFITAKQWQQHDDSACKVYFWLENLRSLAQSLEKLRIPLLVCNCDTYAHIAAELKKIAAKHKCSSLYFNREYEVNEVDRDNDVAKTCRESNIEVHAFHDRVIVPPSEIATKDGRFYSVFTPYRKVWNTKALSFLELSPKPRKQPDIGVKSTKIPTRVPGYDFKDVRSDLWEAGEGQASKRLKAFCKKIESYDENRDWPSIHGTSLLSPYLAAGVISARQCLAAAVTTNKGKIAGKNEGANTWVSELTWRDFYMHVLVGFPRVSKHIPFKRKTESIPWRTDNSDLKAWQSGKTGYPIVDAGMRQLNQTGWMHNRLRMVTAMFLSKHLLIDWRMGERYFMQKLVDGDMAANNGGWQWSASTGTDSVPYFRIFNPFSQSKRFDPEGKFIRTFCPELNEVPSSSLHDAKKLKKSISDHRIEYPNFVVDYELGRKRALDAFKKNK